MLVLQLALFVLGIALAIAGAVLFRATLKTFGGVFGAAVGALSSGGTGGSVLGGVVFGAIVGVVIVDAVYTLFVVGPGLLAGAVIGFATFGSIEAAAVTALVGAAVASALESAILVLSTAFVGGVLVSTALSLGGETALSLQSLDVVSAATAVVAIVGVLVQVGITATVDLTGDRARPEISIWSLVPTAGRAREPGEVILERREGTFSDQGFESRD